MTALRLASLARIADFDSNPYQVQPLDTALWCAGDYLLTEVAGRERSDLYVVEDCSGDMIPVDIGDQIVGALGRRAATLEGVGSFDDVVGGRMHALTSAGLLGAFTSFSVMLPRPLQLLYRGHLVRNGARLTMQQFAVRANGCAFNVPTILIIGTSMSAGKSVTARRVCEVLSSKGIDIVATKLTGAGRYRDIRSFRHAGARHVFDFVDAGLPSTVVDEDEYRAAIAPLLRHIAGLEPDFVVAEAGASPLEPYNVRTAMEALGDNIVCILLAASDPYAVVGVEKAFGVVPDLVTGPAANTSAAVALVGKLAGRRAINVIDSATTPEFTAFLEKKLGLATAARSSA